MKGRKLLALYARVSTDIQVDRDSLANQRKRLSDYAETLKGPFKLFEDAGLSAKDTSRPAFQRMMNAVAVGDIEAVVVTKLPAVTPISSRSPRRGGGGVPVMFFVTFISS